MTRRVLPRALTSFCLAAALSAAHAEAQQTEPDPLESMAIRFGPLGISPSSP